MWWRHHDLEIWYQLRHICHTMAHKMFDDDDDDDDNDKCMQANVEYP